MVTTVTGKVPKFTTVEHTPGQNEQRFVFDVRFE
jgi:hypothetical protein